MIPVLYESTETNFTTQGLGALTNAISCYVTEERNGIYELEMEYPQTGVHFDDIQNGNIIMAIPSPYRDAQPFRIYKVTKPLNGNVTVYANHISYDLNKIPVNPLSATTVSSALSGLKDNMQIQNNFLFWTDKTTTADFSSAVPSACRSLLGGQEGSILDVYGGEYEWDRFTVRLHNQRGEDSGVVIRYGKNLTGLNQEGDITNLVTGICPYWYSDGTLVMCNPPIIYRDGMTAQSAIPVDMTDKFEEAPSQAQLQEAAESYIESNDIGEPSVSITVEFVQMAQMSGYEHLALLEKCDLCDTVKVQYEEAGIDVTAKIVSIQTDVLLEKYESMEIGSIRANIAQTIADQQAQISQIGSSSMLQHAIQNATNWITGGRGGYVIFQLNANGQPDEILIMDTPDIDTATKVWRWNQGGLGYSESGYDGPYSTAITQDGAIVADFITVGTMLANIIHGGTLTLGGDENGNGVCRVLDASGNEVARLDVNGLTSNAVTITGGKLNIENVAAYYKAVHVSDGDQNIAEVAPAGLWSYNRGSKTYASVIPGRIQTGQMNGDNPEDGYTEKAGIGSDGSLISTYAYNTTTSDGANVNVWANGLFRRAASSSRRYKKNITEQIPEELNPEKLYELPVRSFKYRKGYLEKGDRREDKNIIGLIVEELEGIYPVAVNYDKGGRPEMWNAQILIPAMLKLIQEQNERIKKLEGEA